jgi:hypothetical protein
MVVRGNLPDGLRFRFWLEGVLGSITGILGTVSLVRRDWIEGVSGVDPDHGNGTAEWLIVALIPAAPLMLGVARALNGPGLG